MSNYQSIHTVDDDDNVAHPAADGGDGNAIETTRTDEERGETGPLLFRTNPGASASSARRQFQSAWKHHHNWRCGKWTAVALLAANVALALVLVGVVVGKVVVVVSSNERESSLLVGTAWGVEEPTHKAQRIQSAPHPAAAGSRVYVSKRAILEHHREVGGSRRP